VKTVRRDCIVRPDGYSPDTFVAQAPRIKELCADHGLSIPALASKATAVELDDIRRLAEGAALCACPLVRLAAPRSYDGSVPYRGLYAETVEAFGRGP
jgi:hypothetical protein